MTETTEDFAKISKWAVDLWVSFKSEESAFKELFEPRGSKSKGIYWDFLNHCGDIFAAHDDSVDSFESVTPVEANIIPNKLDGRRDKEQGRAASWLMVIAGNPIVVIDETCLKEEVADRNVGSARNHLVLHEIGHLALHWKELAGATDAEGYVNDADPDQEKEAWFFAFAVVTLAVGQLAKQTKGTSDEVWRILWGHPRKP